MRKKSRKALIFLLTAILISGCAGQSQNTTGEENVNDYRQITQEMAETMTGPDADTDSIAALREKFPEYFDLDTFKGLEVYVWQMAKGSWSFGVLPGTNRNKTLEELANLKGATAEEMAAILSTYGIPKENVAIISWQNPISSYIGEYWVRQEDEDPESVAKRQDAYVEKLRGMLFD